MADITNSGADRYAAIKTTLVQTSQGTSGPGGTSGLLQTRLRLLAIIVLAAMLVWMGRSLLGSSDRHLTVQIIGLLLTAAIAAPLWARHAYPRPRLRLIEALLLAATLLRLGIHAYLVVMDRVEANTPLLALAEVYNASIAVGALIVVYGMLVPNTWQRTATAALMIATVPLVGLGALYGLDPQGYAALMQMVGREVVTDLALALFASVLTAVAGSQIIYALRREAIAARDMGQYELYDRIAVGGMGEIWRASHRFLARPAAIKVIQPEKVDPLNPSAAARVLERFEKEAQSTAQLESQHTVRVYDFGRTRDGEFYYAMELLKGFDVEELIARYGPTTPGRAIYLLLQACESLAEAHELGQVHRDVKPSNLFLCKVGRAFDVVKMLDFGLVTRSGSEEGRDARLQEEGMTGTPAYMAPEQVLAVTSIDERADIYALGCVAYWMLTGHTVFDIDRPIAMAVAHVKAPPMPPSRRTEVPIPADLERIIMQCLEKEPDRRPRTAEALAHQLLECESASAWNSETARDWWLRHRPLEGPS
jgi:serine/threonine-protein kinase